MCVGSVCQAPTCFDTVRNGNESAVDCGGTCALRCAAGATCGAPADCQSNVCSGGTCQAPSCFDGARNGNETAQDCGGSCAARCTAGQGCLVNGDCVSAVCSAGACQGASCGDGIRNGSESAVDCGGSCPPCIDGQTCNQPSDCVSGSCQTVCLPVSCTDGIRNGTESAVDCGGTCPNRCSNGATCNAGTDCTSGSCYQGLCCQPQTCTGLGLQCGTVSNGCGVNLDCGGCTNSLTCQSGQCQCSSGACPGCPLLYSKCCKSSTQCGCRLLLSCN